MDLNNIEWRDRSFLGYKPFDKKKDRRERFRGPDKNYTGHNRPTLTENRPFIPHQEMSYGIESRWLDREYEDGERRVFEIKVRLPKAQHLRRVTMSRNNQGIYTHTLKQRSKHVVAVCALDLVSRLFYEPGFDECEKEDEADGVEQMAQAFERVILGLDRHQHRVGGD
jgi:hypothetical protein